MAKLSQKDLLKLWWLKNQDWIFNILWTILFIILCVGTFSPLIVKALK